MKGCEVCGGLLSIYLRTDGIHNATWFTHCRKCGAETKSSVSNINDWQRFDNPISLYISLNSIVPDAFPEIELAECPRCKKNAGWIKVKLMPGHGPACAIACEVCGIKYVGVTAEPMDGITFSYGGIYRAYRRAIRKWNRASKMALRNKRALLSTNADNDRKDI